MVIDIIKNGTDTNNSPGSQIDPKVILGSDSNYWIGSADPKITATVVEFPAAAQPTTVVDQPSDAVIMSSIAEAVNARHCARDGADGIRAPRTLARATSVMGAC